MGPIYDNHIPKCYVYTKSKLYQKRAWGGSLMIKVERFISLKETQFTWKYYFVKKVILFLRAFSKQFHISWNGFRLFLINKIPKLLRVHRKRQNFEKKIKSRFARTKLNWLKCHATCSKSCIFMTLPTRSLRYYIFRGTHAHKRSKKFFASEMRRYLRGSHLQALSVHFRLQAAHTHFFTETSHCLKPAHTV